MQLRSPRTCGPSPMLLRPRPRSRVVSPVECHKEGRCWGETVRHAVAGVVVGAVHCVWLSAFPDLSLAVLNSPPASLPRTADAALRRSIPAFNSEVQQIQTLMEGIAQSLRIPQRKPWGSMQQSVEEAKLLVQDTGKMLDGVPEERRAEGEALAADILQSLGKMELCIDEQKADKLSFKLADVLGSVSELQLLQTPGLPYLIPRVYSDRPRLTGRATVQLELQLKEGSEVVEIVLDGFSAPLSAGVFASKVADHSFDQQTLAVDRDSVVLRSNGAAQGSSVPLEILPVGQFEPLYRNELDVQTGEVPVLPMSIFGSVSLSHAPDENEMSSSDEAFIFKFNRETAGLGGMAFDEGRFSVIGYVTRGLETIKTLRTGDQILRASIIKGAENLIQPQTAEREPV